MRLLPLSLRHIFSRRARTLLALLCGFLFITLAPDSATAQINPFEDESESTAEESAEEADDAKDQADDTKNQDEDEDDDTDDEEGERSGEKAGEEASTSEEDSSAGDEEETRDTSEPDAEDRVVLVEEEDEEASGSDAPKEDRADEKGGVSVYGDHVPPKSVQRVPLTANFSTLELATTLAVGITGPTLLVTGSEIFDQPTPSIGPPQFGSLDYEISIAQHGDLETGDSALWGIPDVAGYLLPSALGAHYAVSAIYFWSTGETLFDSQTNNIDHSAVAFVEAFGWTTLATALVKTFVGRQRPYAALNRPNFDTGREDVNESFFSGHTAASFMIASFVSWDLSDHLVYRSIEGSYAKKFWLGRVVPLAGFHLLAAGIAYTRIIDQQHFFSDIVTGAAVGSLVGNTVYLAHFGPRGNPRIRHPENVDRDQISVRPTLLRARDSSVPGLGLSGTW